MKRTTTVVALAASALVTGAAKSGEVEGFLLVVGAIVAVFVAFGLPIALLLHACRPDWIAAEARAVESRATACVVVGSGLAVAALAAVAVLAPRAPWLALAVTAAATAWFLVGFAGCARRQGERMLSVDPADPALRPLVLGWLARAGLFAVPVVWPFLGMYLVVVAFGAPIVAMFATGQGLGPRSVGATSDGRGGSTPGL